MSYNGWNNYETWNVALWIDNEQGSYYYARELVRDAHGSSSTLADSLRAWIEDSQPEMEASLYSDLLGAALGAVDWYEIAEHYIEDEDEDEDEDEESET